MIDGLWTVEVISNINLSGKGVLVFSNGRLLGGDEAYYYTGTYELSGQQIQGNVNIIRFDPESISVFGDIDKFSLIFYGDIENNSFVATTTVINNPSYQFKIIANKKEDLP